MRSIWKGAISFGLVSIPVKVYSATEERDIAFRQVRRSDGSRIRVKRVAAADGEEVPYADIARGYELPGGEIVMLTDDDFAGLPLRTSRAIDVLGFVPPDQVDPIYFAKSYYLEPDQTGAKPYVLVRDALERSGRVALVKIAMRSRERLGALRVRNGVFVLTTMLWPDEVRTPDFGFVDEQVEVRSPELAMAELLIETLAADFDPSQYRDSYREALQAVIEAKVAGRDVVPPPSEDRQPDVVGDLIAALQASVAAARRSRGEPPTASGGEAAPGGEVEPVAGTTGGAGPTDVPGTLGVPSAIDVPGAADGAGVTDAGGGGRQQPPPTGGSAGKATKTTKAKPKKSGAKGAKATTSSKRRRTA